MKTKQLFLCMLALMGSITAHAYDIASNGVYYDITDADAKTVEVTYGSDLTDNANYYSGSITIPQQISYKGVTYNVTSIGFGAFHYCSDLTSITIPNSVTSIGEFAFRDCSGLTSIILPNNLTSIEGSAFKNSGLTSITIPNSVTSIGEQAFWDCSSLTSITLSNSLTSIGASAFRNTGLTSITIPNSMTQIGPHAFSYCTKLTSITIPNSVTKIGTQAFEYCSSLTSITIPNSVTDIWANAFMYCTSLTSITLPNSLTRIINRVFTYCSSLTSITIPNSVTSIGDYAFQSCSSLTSITIPNSVTSIGDNAFQSCSSLTSITIPNSVTQIGYKAFYQCNSLTSVRIDNPTPPSISISDQNTFSNSANATLYVPYGSKAAYQANSFWRRFRKIEEMPNPNAITVGSTGYATFCSPKAMDFTSVDGIKAYIASGFNPDTGTLVLTRVTEVPAGEGLYIVGTPDTYNVPETTTAMMYSNLLKGVTSATTISPTDGSNTNFILANGTHGVGFYTLSDAGEIAAGKAYLQLPTASLSSNVKAINFAFSDDSETGINETKDVREVKEVYNLQGQRVNQPKHGLYIINGKKFIIK